MSFNLGPEEEFSKKVNAVEAFSIIGIIASSAKMGALEQFFNHMLPTSGLAFIITQQGPVKKNKVLTIETLIKYTTMSIHYAQDNIEIMPNCIYLIPPQKAYTIREGRLVNDESGRPSGQSLPADRFMFALAESLGCKAICVYFTDGGIDGVNGMEAINSAGGMIMVEAKLKLAAIHLTESEIAADQVDYQLAPQEMPWHILEYIKFYTSHTKESIEEERAVLFGTLYQATGVDFSQYKQASVLRRIQRRMGLQGFSTLTDYNQFLDEHSDEVAALQKDLLIGVTHFFEIRMHLPS